MHRDCICQPQRKLRTGTAYTLEIKLTGYRERPNVRSGMGSRIVIPGPVMIFELYTRSLLFTQI
jgi:hypothetical protein